jgi:hypothetical protein
LNFRLAVIRPIAESEGLTASLARFCGMQNYPAFFGVGISLDLAIALFSFSGAKLRPENGWSGRLLLAKGKLDQVATVADAPGVVISVKVSSEMVLEVAKQLCTTSSLRLGGPCSAAVLEFGVGEPHQASRSFPFVRRGSAAC